jgi:DNA-binding PadR family transcriptional regulator
MPRASGASPSLREFELVVMLAVLGLAGDGYPVTIRDAIEARTGRKASRAAVFITLERLERKRFLVSRFGDPTPVRGGRAKRFFRTTPRGIAAVKASLDIVASMTAGLESVIGP